ncbi:MAG: HlyC/CorC family transporter [Deltaproteobacteria bacterium]|nr:HlyC/CorC family transporter [Deltaproteobacteria bacterium]MBW1928696.1 HlyC/CorC family transporter [Deltaproteobacteria bacterium]MBW2027187.1 HlyC/CorC family transporter [Deltaproteobacteria bacterium]
MAELILAVTLAILISAGCSLMEAVLYSVPMRQIEGAVLAGKAGSKVFKMLRENIERPIAAILSLNTIAHTAGAAVAGAAATAVFGHAWLGYFSFFFTLAILLFSEIIPKTAGVVYGPSLIPFVAYPLKGLVRIMTPAIWLTNVITRMVARGKTEEAITAEELRIMARLSLRSGEINPYQEQVIENILTLQNKTVKEVMTPRTVIFSLSEHLTVKEASQIPPKWEHSRFPVYDQDQEDIVGIVLTRELFVTLSQGKEETKLTDLMRPVHFVVETARLNAVFIEFLERKEHLFVVLDEYGGIAGLITLEDVLEEILGREIVDEFDQVEDKRELARRRRKMLMGQ